MCLPRKLIETELFVKEKTLIEPDAKRMDEILFGITWALARHPEHFPKVPGTNRLYMAPTDSFPDAPAMRIWYTFSNQEVLLLSIELTPEED